MKKHLFFDDNRLFGRDNLERKYGKAELVSVYNDGVSSTDLCTSYVFKLDNGKYRLLYTGLGEEFSGVKLFSAISDDGINFKPEKLPDTISYQEKKYPHEIMHLPKGKEPVSIYEDKYSSADERYKLLMAEHDRENLTVYNTIYTSSDMINWSKKDGVYWGGGAEPLAWVFYNKHKGVHTIMERPFWGVRCVGYKETKDWKTFSEFQLCLNVDSCDERLSEIYGMYAFEYDGMYIGLPHMYRHLESEYNAKYKNGIIDTQLAYSYDGRYWLRSLREPFISGLDTEQKDISNHNLMWVSDTMKLDDGNLYFYASASEYEHGYAFSHPGTGKILIYKLRNDGFISLSTQDKDAPSSLITREKVWNGGEIHINIKANRATMAVYDSCETEHIGGNILGHSKPLEGYTHDDCVPFSGDCTDWIPEYKNGNGLNCLKGKTLVFELKLDDGEVYSLTGDFEDVFNTEAARYRKFGLLPGCREERS